MTITGEMLQAHYAELRKQEREESTIEKYRRDLSAFAAWLGDRALTKEEAIAWKTELQGRCAPSTVNAALAALNGLFRFLRREDCCMRFLKLQRRAFREQTRELTEREFKRLVVTARGAGKERLALLLEALGGTGIRVGELRYLTVEAARVGKAEIALKGKIRTILLPAILRRKLLDYAKRCGIVSGAIFRTRSGRPLSRRQVWAEMKSVSAAAGVERSKVFPHNLRHLFAVTFYRACKDIVKLADVLGHSSIDTTRLYLMTTEKEHRRQLDRLRLVL